MNDVHGPSYRKDVKGLPRAVRCVVEGKAVELMVMGVPLRPQAAGELVAWVPGRYLRGPVAGDGLPVRVAPGRGELWRIESGRVTREAVPID